MGKKSSSQFTSFVGFKNSQGITARATLVRLSRQQVVFEVYNPYSIVQLSEVLTELRILQGEREVYHGRAVVTGLLNTGLMLIVTASLVDPWSDLKGLKPGDTLRSFVHDFVSDWEAGIERLDKSFQVSVSNLRNYLQELSRWLEHWETEAGVKEAGVSHDLLTEFVADVDREVTPKIGELTQTFEETSRAVPKNFLPYHRAYAQRELHPLMMCSPFMYRAFAKPLGYAGDFIMVKMMLGDPWQGPTTFAKLLNAAALRQDAPTAHRNRIRMLHEVLVREVSRVAATGRRAQILNIGCGPAVEVLQFIRSNEVANHVDLTLVDFNRETLEDVHANVIPEAKRLRPQMRIVTEQRSVHDIIKMSVEAKIHEPPTYDMVYCAGLFDYFRDTTCGFLLQLYYSWVVEGGVVLVTNVTPVHSSLATMGLVLEWILELRDTAKMRELLPGVGQQQTYEDTTKGNVFLEIRKPIVT